MKKITIFGYVFDVEDIASCYKCEDLIPVECLNETEFDDYICDKCKQKKEGK